MTKMLVCSKLKAFVDDNFNKAQTAQFLVDIVENIVREGENAVYQHFILFPQRFLNVSFSGSLKIGI